MTPFLIRWSDVPSVYGGHNRQVRGRRRVTQGPQLRRHTRQVTDISFSSVFLYFQSLCASVGWDVERQGQDDDKEGSLNQEMGSARFNVSFKAKILWDENVLSSCCGGEAM